MSKKKKKRKHKSNNRGNLVVKNSHQNLHPDAIKLFKWLFGIALTLLLAICPLAIPNISVSLPQTTLNKEDPFATPFILKNNNSLFSIFNIKAETSIVRFEDSKHFIIENSTTKTYINNSKELKSGHEVSIDIDLKRFMSSSVGSLFTYPLKEGKIRINVYYVPDFPFLTKFQKHEIFNYKIMTSESGQTTWFPATEEQMTE